MSVFTSQLGYVLLDKIVVRVSATNAKGTSDFNYNTANNTNATIKSIP